MIIKEWKCDEHGYFESDRPECPDGCLKGISQVFLTPVKYKSNRTKNIDKTTSQLALDYKMSDIKTVREGEAQPPRLANKEPTPQSDRPTGVMWGNPKSISNYNLKSVNGETINGLAAVKEGGVALTKPRTASYIADHQNLKIEK